MHFPLRFQVNWTSGLVSVIKWSLILKIFTPIYFFIKYIKHSKNYQYFNLDSYFKAQIYEVFLFVHGFSKFFMVRPVGLRKRTRGLRTLAFEPIKSLSIIGSPQTMAIKMHKENLLFFGLLSFFDQSDSDFLRTHKKSQMFAFSL